MAEADMAADGPVRNGTGDPAGERSPLRRFGPVSPAASLPQAGSDDAVIDRLGPQLGHALAKRLAFRTVPLALDRPVMSITFDDFPASAHESGADLLERFGARGTFFTATGLLGRTTPLWTIAGPEAVVDLHRRGHEIGLHTHSHRAVFDMDARAFEADLAANRAALRRLLPGLTRETFAYPFGFAGYRPKRQLSRLTRASRAVQPGINADVLDPDFVKAVELVDCGLTTAGLARLLDETVARRGWLVFLTHDIAADPSRFGASPALLEAALAGAEARGIEILSVSAALDRIGVP